MDSKEVEKVLKKWFKLKPKYCDIEIAGQIIEVDMVNVFKIH